MKDSISGKIEVAGGQLYGGFRAGGIRAERKAGGMQIVLFGAPPLQLPHGREGGRSTQDARGIAGPLGLTQVAWHAEMADIVELILAGHQRVLPMQEVQQPTDRYCRDSGCGWVLA